MNKKGAMDRDTVLGFLVGILVLAVIFYMIYKYSSGSFTQLNSEQLRQSRDACKAEMNKIPKPTDADNDGLPDNMQKLGVWCDLCVGGDDNLDDDGDGVPNACDINPTVPFDTKKSSFEKECRNMNPTTKRCQV
jgi:hypothetical protein